MGKRSDFERAENDFYPTPYEAVVPLLPFLPQAKLQTNYIEPCAGDGQLIGHLQKHGYHCSYACDLKPRADFIKERDVLFFDGQALPLCDLIITNPPWERSLLHPMIERFRNHAKTWLLFDSDWMFTGQAKPYLKFCRKIVSVGRISWMQNGVSAMDNCCWYEFTSFEAQPIFYP